MRRPQRVSRSSAPTDDGFLLVIGSLNMDLTVSVDALPAPGATLLAHGYQTSPGGKGANQAVAAARLGAPTRMLGRVGNDAYGKALEASLRANGVGVDSLGVEADTPTGLALITVERSGQNTIVVVSGANWRLAPSDVASARPLIERAGMVLLQQEVPEETVEAAIMTAAEVDTPVLLNPAPARPVRPEALSRVDYLIPNETEAVALAGMERLPDTSGGNSEKAASAEGSIASRNNRRLIVEAAQRLRRQGVANVVITLGEQGAYARIGDDERWVPPFAVEAVDATAAGDAFVAAFATRLIEGAGAGEALRFAAAAGALTATRPGAQRSLPGRAEVDRFLGPTTSEGGKP